MVKGEGNVRKCIYKTWFTNKVGTIEIAVFEDEFGYREVRMSKVDGYDEELDTVFVDEWGSAVNPAVLIEIVEQFRMGKRRWL